MVEQMASKRGAPRWQRVLAYGVPIVAWLVFSIPPRESDDTAYYTGQIFGGALVALGLALLIRLAYWLIRGRSRPFWSSWIFVLAATFALIARAGDAAG
jgi:hypothetical protein